MLLDEKMLPGIKIRIPQMEDLLQAEQAYLDVVLEVVEWLRERMILLNEEVMNIPNLKAKIKQITEWDCIHISSIAGEFCCMLVCYFCHNFFPPSSFYKSLFCCFGCFVRFHISVTRSHPSNATNATIKAAIIQANTVYQTIGW